MRSERNETLDGNLKDGGLYTKQICVSLRYLINKKQNNSQFQQVNKVISPQ